MVKEYGYEYDAVLNQSIWDATKGKTTKGKLWGAYCLRSGRDALKAIAREYSPRVVLLPALACDSMLFPFEMYGHQIRYYKLNKDYSIDMDSLDIGQHPVLFLYMEYFGKKAISDAELEQMKTKGNMVFIEDRTHNLIWERTSSFQPDYTIASLRKWIPVPDGGLLWGSIKEPFNSDTAFSQLRLQAQCMRHQYFQSGDEKIKTEYRKIFSEVSDLMDHDEPCRMSAYSYALAKKTDWEEVCSQRKKNAEILISILQQSPYITLIQDKAGLSDLYVAFIVPNRDRIQRQLSAEGIFNTIIWPISDDQKAACGVAKHTEQNMLAAPCDQRYTADDMNYIGKEIVRVTADVNR
jgi:hypothetical protein